MDISWKNIDDIDDFYITYLLYKDSFTIPQISRIRNKSIEEVNNDLIEAKSYFREIGKVFNEKDVIEDYLGMDKDTRLKFISDLDEEGLSDFKSKVYKGILDTKNIEDLIVYIWTCGELKDKRFLKLLYALIERNHVHIRRIAYSAIGKIAEPESRYVLELGLLDDNPQVRQYCAKYLSDIGNLESIRILENLVKNKAEFEKEYVIRACNSTLYILYEKFGIKK